MIDSLPARVNANAALVRRGRFVQTTFLLETGETAWLVTVDRGRIAEVQKGPFVMPRWTFALRASTEAWGKFWAANPEPGFHDLFALIKHRRLKAEGDLHPFMSNLFYFKGVLGSLREGAGR
ncbi:MAG: hypothetical protein ABW360_02845 [Phenylobacterium sp.]